MPKDLKPGVLYVSEQFGAAAHLCACGCGSKIRTPIGPTEWSVEETDVGPTLHPSVGNWQQACQSHYVGQWMAQLNNLGQGAAPRRTRGSALPLFARRTKAVGDLLPDLYLHGLAQGISRTRSGRTGVSTSSTFQVIATFRWRLVSNRFERFTSFQASGFAGGHDWIGSLDGQPDFSVHERPDIPRLTKSNLLRSSDISSTSKTGAGDMCSVLGTRYRFSGNRGMFLPGHHLCFTLESMPG